MAREVKNSVSFPARWRRMARMEEQHANGSHAPQLPPDSFAGAVAQALELKGASVACRECEGAEGWQDWMMVPTPSALPLMPDPAVAAQVLLMVALTCKRCAYTRLYRMDVLGIQLQERRIVTP